MSSILYFCPAFAIETEGDFISDFIKHIVANGHTLSVIIPTERRNHEVTHIERYDGYKIIKVKTLNYRGCVGLIEKGVSTLLMGFQFKNSVTKYFHKEKVDIAIFQTLPITYYPAISVLKKRSTFIYLLHKDIFPQSAVDLGIFSKYSIFYCFFRSIEKRLYRSCDQIGVMTPKNVEYLLENNPYIIPTKVEVCPNTMKPFSDSQINMMKSLKDSTRQKYGIPSDLTVFVYGGNIGRAQGVQLIANILEKSNDVRSAFLLFIGNGNEFDKLHRIIEDKDIKNAKILKYLPKKEYDELIAACDVGMVFLDYRFTIANIPSRTLAYINIGLPIIAATDNYTDYRTIIEENDIGVWSPSNDTEKFLENLRMMSMNKSLLSSMSINSRRYLREKCTVDISYNIIIKHIK